MKARQLDYGFGHFDFYSVHFFGESRESKPSVDENFAALRNALEYAVADPVPCIAVDPQSLVLIGVCRELLYGNRELNYFVSGITERNGMRLLTDITYHGYGIVHGGTSSAC